MPKLFSNLINIVFIHTKKLFHIDLFIQYLYGTFFHEVVLQMWRNIWNKFKNCFLSNMFIYLAIDTKFLHPIFNIGMYPLYISSPPYVAHHFSLFVISVSISSLYPFLFIYSLKYLLLIISPNPLVFIFIIFIYFLPIPWSLILSIFTLLIVLKDLYKTWWNQYFKIEKEKIKEGYDLLLIFKKKCFQRNKKILFWPKVQEIASLESITALKVLSTLKVVAPSEFCP